jgi:hypothetical protein
MGEIWTSPNGEVYEFAMSLPYLGTEFCVHSLRAISFTVYLVRVKWGLDLNTAVWIIAHVPDEVIDVFTSINSKVVAIFVSCDMQPEILIHGHTRCCIEG